MALKFWNSSANSNVASRLIKEALPSRWKMYSLSLICMVGIAAFTGAFAYSTKLIVNDVFVADSTVAAWKVAAFVIAVSIGRSFFGYANSVLSVQLNRSVAAHYQKKVFAKVIQDSVRSFQGEHAAKHLNTVLLVGRATGKLLVNVMNNMLTDALTLIVLIGIMIYQDPYMSLMGVVLFPLIYYLISQLSDRIRAIANAENTLGGAVRSVGSEAIEGIKTVKSYGLENKTVENFSGAVDKLEKRMMSLAKTTSLTMPVMEFLGGTTLGLFVIYASWQTTTYGKTPGEFTAFITAFLLAYQPAERLSKSIVDVQKSLFQVARLYNILDKKDPENRFGNATLNADNVSLTFNKVSFRYTNNAAALRDISFTVRPGERVAIVGRSGAGKTTAIDLLQRFFDPTRGQILFDDVNIATLSRAALRDSIAYISQDVFLFDGTVRENIADGNPLANDAEIEKAAKLAQVDVFADALPKGLDSPIGPNGSSLSGGQKQRIGIARALVKQAKIYIYDEATSALDGDTERAIMEAAVNHSPGSIILFVTHRPSTLKWVDRVIMLEAGRLVAVAKHDTLVAENENYRTMFNIVKLEKKPKAS